MKRILLLILSLLLIFSLAACGIPTTDPVATDAPVPDATTEDGDKQLGADAKPVQPTWVQQQEARYVPISEVGEYNTDIITDDILQDCTLTPVDKAALPYWTGCILENKISVNYRRPQEWADYTAGPWHFNEEEIRYLSENGFNCVRALYSLSFLSNPEDVYSINLSELEQLDELIAWCAKYNVHLILSQTGLPGKWGSWGDGWRDDFEMWDNEENVRVNMELFTSPDMQKTYTAYYDMLAKRYENIGNGILSFELAVEAAVPDGDERLYTDVLAPVAETIWSHNQERIVIVNDVWRAVPEQLAKIGCCISMHNHIFTLDPDSLEGSGLGEYQIKWSMQYLPHVMNETSAPLKLRAENEFSAGTLTICYAYSSNSPRVMADGLVIHPSEHSESEAERAAISVEIPTGTKELSVDVPWQTGFLGFRLTQDGKPDIALATHGLYANVTWEPEDMPTLLIRDDMSVEDISDPKIELNAAYFQKQYLQPFIDCAREHGVSFLMTEIGTDGAVNLSPAEYVDYEEEWLSALKNNGIGWMYNASHSILAPENLMGLNAENSRFTEFSDVPNMYSYQVNNVVMDMLKRYQ